MAEVEQRVLLDRNNELSHTCTESIIIGTMKSSSVSRSNSNSSYDDDSSYSLEDLDVIKTIGETVALFILSSDKGLCWVDDAEIRSLVVGLMMGFGDENLKIKIEVWPSSSKLIVRLWQPEEQLQ